MKPLNLQGHSRPIKKVVFSQNGDLLYTASADRNIISWFTHNGEKCKTYAHSAAVNTLTLTSAENNSNTSYMISGDNTGCTYIWDCKNGTLLKKIEHDPILSVRSLDIIDLSLLMVVYAGRTKLAQSFINIYKFDDLMQKYLTTNSTNNLNNITYSGGNNRNNTNKNFYEGGSIYSMSNLSSNTSTSYNKPNNYNNFNNSFNNYNNFNNNFNNYNNFNSNFSSNSNNFNQTNNSANKSTTISHEQIVPHKHFECMTNLNTKYVIAKFVTYSTNQGKFILASREDGCMEMINFSNGKIVFENKFHEDVIFDFDIFIDKNLVLTASKDGLACLFNLDTLDVISKFKPENPVRYINTCLICRSEVEKLENVEIEVKEKVENLEKLENINNEEKVDVDSLFGIEKINLNSTNQKIEKIVCVIAGGMDTKNVTTSKQEGGFEVIGYNIDTTTNNETDFLVNTHFGPVNSIAYSEKKKLLASGSEDSTVKIYIYDNKVLNSYK